MDVEVSDEMVEAIAQLFDPDAWHPNLKQDGRGVYWHSRRFHAREKAKATIPLIAAQVEADTIERCAKVAEGVPEQYLINKGESEMRERIATAIRSLSEEEKG